MTAHPAPRYTVGPLFQRALPFFNGILPKRLIDRLIGRYYRLT